MLARVAQRARNVLDVDGILPRGRLVAERAERLEVALQRHEIEPPAEFGRLARPSRERQEIRDQIVYGGLGQIHVRVAQERDEVVRVRSETRVLKVDDEEIL